MSFIERENGTLTLNDFTLNLSGASVLTLADSSVLNLSGSGVISVANGTASAPSYSFTADATSGMFLQTGGSNFLHLAVSGQDILYFGISNPNNVTTELLQGTLTIDEAGTLGAPALWIDLNGGGSGVYAPSSGVLGISVNTNTTPVAVANFDSTGIKLIDGTASNPSYSFSNNLQTGFYFKPNDSTNDGIGWTAPGAGGVVGVLASDGLRLLNGTYLAVTYDYSGNSGSIYLGANENSWIWGNNSQIGFSPNAGDVAHFQSDGLHFEASKAIFAANGTDSNPSYAFSASPAAGFFWDSSNAVVTLSSAANGLAIKQVSGALFFGTIGGPTVQMSYDETNFTFESNTLSPILSIDGTTGLTTFSYDILAPNGSATNPSYAFSSASNVGLYYKAADSQPAGMVFAATDALRCIFSGNSLNFYDGFYLSFASDFDGGIFFGPGEASSINGNDTRLEFSTNSVLALTINSSQQLDVHSHKIINVTDPTSQQDAATKVYVDNVAAGLDVKAAVRVATTVNLTATAAGSGVGKTLTNSGTQVALSIDGVALSASDRVLVKNQTTASNNGIYTVTNIGSVSTNWVLTRATDFDGSPSNEVSGGDFVFVEAGTQIATGWTVIHNGAIIVDTDPINWTQFNASTVYTADESTLHLAGTTFSVKTGFSPLFGADGTATAPTYSFSSETGLGWYRGGSARMSLAFGTVEAAFFDGTTGVFSLKNNYNMQTNAGTAAVPGYSFNGDSDTGLYNNAANEFAVTTGGTVSTLFTVLGVNSAKIRLDDGTAALPSVTFQNDTDTGIYRAGANDLGISAGGTLQLEISPNKALFTGIVGTGDGTVSVPAYTFGADQDTGIYRFGTNEIGITCGGTLVEDISAAGIDWKVSGTTTMSIRTGQTWFLDGTLGAPSMSFITDQDTGLRLAGSGVIDVVGNGASMFDFNPTVNRSKVLFQILATGMQNVDGTAGAPSYTFSSDTDCGLARLGTNTPSMVAGGVVAQQWQPTQIFFGAQTLRLGQDGSASTPVFTWDTDPDTGMFRAGANAIGFVAGGSDIVEITTADIRPGSDNAYSCGESGRRWTTVYATTGTINTSHSSTKQNIVELDWQNLQVPAGVEYDRDGRRHMGYLNDSLPDVARPFNADGTISHRDNYENAVIGILCATVNGLKEEVKALKAKLGV